MGRKARRKMSDFPFILSVVLHGMLGLLLDVYYCEKHNKELFLEAWECSVHWQMNRFSGDGNILGIALGKKPTSRIIMVPHRQPGSQRSPSCLLPGMCHRWAF